MLNEKDKNKKYEKELKVILVGESGTGKTSLINSVQGQVFYEGTQISTLMSSFIKVELTINEKKYSVNLWDTIGQEKYRSLTNLFLNGAQIVIFVFDITSKGSFEQLDYWFDLINKKMGDDVIKGIAANKFDLFEYQDVEEDLIVEYAKKHGVKYSYTTANDIKGFNEFLNNLILDYVEKNKDKSDLNGSQSNKGKTIDNLSLNRINRSTNSKCC